MKIGLVCPYNIFADGGVQAVVKELQKRLTLRGHNVVIISPQPPGGNHKTQKGIKLVGLSRNLRALSTTAQVSLSFDSKKLNQILYAEKFDVINFHEPWVPVLSSQILSRSTCPVVATFHAKLPPGPLIKLFKFIITPYTRSIIKKFETLCAVSSAAAEYAKSISKMPISIIPNGIDLNKYQAPTIKNQVKSGKTILYVGRLEKRKGVEYLIKAFEKAVTDSPDLKLIIVGDGKLKQKLQKQASSLPEGSVEFLGFINEQDKIKLLQKCDLFCSPAIYGESFGIVLLEAMACGAVVVAGDNPGYKSVLVGNGGEALVNPKQTQKFANKLLKMSSNVSARNNWLAWSKNEIKKYNWEKVADQYEALYKEALKG